MKNLEIALAQRNHIPEIYDLVKELAEYENAPEEVETNIDSYYKDFEEGVFEAIVALIDQKVIGVVIFYQAFSTWKGKMIYLEDFVIKEDYRKNGVGQLLFDELIKLAQKKNAKLLKWQVLDWNEPAIKFYEKNNAIIEKEWWNGKIKF